ncbi:hypothetical protein KEM52_002506 [Ascosphaera acerosa]|nr:hypothetical protein KEM52_002506 [Ascosphaera acerosa]
MLSDISSASLYLAAKSSFHPRSARQIVNVYHYLTSPAASPLDFVNPRGYRQARLEEPNPDSYVLSDGGLDRAKNQLYELESLLLAGLGFDTRVALPYAIAMTYLQTLGFRERANNQLGARVVAHLNAALLSPQLLYLTHQPNALAVAAIYLAARELEVKLVAGNWWEVFDVTREDLGFLVLAMNSMQGFAREEHETWAGQGRPVPLTADDLRRYIQHNSSSDQG